MYAGFELIEVTDDVKERNSRLQSQVAEETCLPNSVNLQNNWCVYDAAVAACSLIRKHDLLGNAKVFWNSYLIEAPLLDGLPDDLY